VIDLAKKINTKEKLFAKKAKKSSAEKISPHNGHRERASTKRILFFLAIFFLIYFILGEIINLLDLSILTNAIASFSASFLGGAVSGSTVTINGAKFVVSNMCTGLVSASILAAVVFSLRKPELKKRVALFAAGTALLMLINIPRVILVLAAAKMGFDAEMVHMLTWFLMSAAILLIWYYGTKIWAGVSDFSELI
jgi:exosortase/archaeosortase family protein